MSDTSADGDDYSAPRPDAPPSTALTEDRDYLASVIDLLGVLAYTELIAFERLAADAATAPSISEEAALALMATAEIRHFTRLAERLAELGADPSSAMEPFVEPITEFHVQTAPGDWLESLVKAYVGDGFATDFYREVARSVDPDTRALVLEVCGDTGHSNFAVATVRAAIEADPRLAGRLALWGRRLVGEAISQAQRIAADRDGLASLIVGGVGRPGMGLGELGAMFSRLTEAHTTRMKNLGLAP
ncbi:unannotated protein [freshwater metagenome]|uniref:Unannotated protein n=1 Tax=freshwater metagenome TaxID=449393 RepID=A0A6J7RNQ9_9ZZZZ|nr:hypothetical protein [Actinomycetota bacterium]MSW35802.1 hypothetical protein [Actinomycetota bacterium]